MNKEQIRDVALGLGVDDVGFVAAEEYRSLPCWPGEGLTYRRLLPG